MSSKSKVITASILILAGAASVMGNLDIFDEYFVLSILGIIFLFVYVLLGARKKYSNIGFLIPAIILPALQLLKIADDNSLDDKAVILIVFGILSVSFLAIYLIHSCWYKQVSRGQRNWPLYVSVILLLAGVIIYGVEYFNWEFGRVLLNNAWPIVLVIVGGRMLYKVLKGNKKDLNN